MKQLLCLGFLILPISVFAQSESDADRIKALEDRVSKIESGSAGAANEGEGAGVITPAIPGVPKMFLPDIGIAGDFAYETANIPKTDPRYDPALRQPRIRDGQVVFFSPIDPFTDAQFTIDLPETGPANIEEGWIRFKKLPGNVTGRLGRFIPKFGLYNELNTFQLPMSDRPNSVADYITQDGLNGTGANANFFIPNPWDVSLQGDVNVVQGNVLGGMSQSRDLGYLGTLEYSTDFYSSGVLRAGSSVAQGPSPFGRAETLEDPYLQVQYAIDQRHVWTWSTEGMMAQRQGLGGGANSKAGFYSFLDYNFGSYLRYHLGFLVDNADQPSQPYGRQLSLAPNATWFVSDNTRLRLQYTHITPLGPERPEEKVTLQATFSLGNLKQLD